MIMDRCLDADVKKYSNLDVLNNFESKLSYKIWVKLIAALEQQRFLELNKVYGLRKMKKLALNFFKQNLLSSK